MRKNSFPRRRTGVRVLGVVVGLALAVALPAAASAANIGNRGPSFAAGASGAPSGYKSESKLWFNDGIWWAVMFTDKASGNTYNIFRFHPTTRTWSNTGFTIDTRDSSRQDVLWSGGKLYVASHVFDSDADLETDLNANPMKLYRYSYNASSNTYSLDNGFPVNIVDDQKSETLTIARDSTGRIWASWVSQESGGAYRVMTAVSAPSCGTGGACAFGPPTPITGSAPVEGGGANGGGDISAIIHFGNKIGVMWSDELSTPNAYGFATHADGAGLTTWSLDNDPQLTGAKFVEDHINLKTAGGKVYAATKTKFTGAEKPGTMLRVRSAAGNWTNYTVSFGVDARTRPIVVLDTARQVIHVFETGPYGSATKLEHGAGDIYDNTSRMTGINFAVSPRTPVMHVDSPQKVLLNNVTSSKQNANGTSKVLAVASSESQTGNPKTYWASYRGLTTPPAHHGGGCTIRGTNGRDVIDGTNHRDVICGRGGNDVIHGLGGNDRIIGGGGNDRIVGGSGKDVLNGGRGSDRLVGGKKADTLRGKKGSDSLKGGGGRDRYTGGGGRDTLKAHDGIRERVKGGSGRDRGHLDRRDIRRSVEVLF